LDEFDSWKLLLNRLGAAVGGGVVDQNDFDRPITVIRLAY
jgi:hypothetical protein